MAAPSEADSPEEHSLCGLKGISLETATDVLRERFYNSIQYTTLSDSVLIFVNPFSCGARQEQDDVLRQYIADFRKTSKSFGADLPPHIFQLATNAYYYMYRTGQDQSIITVGDTSSGKSDIRRQAVQALLYLGLTAPGKKGHKLATQVPSAEYIFETFGHCQTLENPNASRYGKYTELQFSEAGRLIGSKTLCYYLEKSRLNQYSAGERTFHIFYALLACSAEEKHVLGLDSSTPFRYLGSFARSEKDVLASDAARFSRLKHAFKSLNFSKKQVSSICQILSAILHLGNVEFYQDRHRTQEAAAVSNFDALEAAASNLEISAKSLEEAMTYRTKMIGREVCTVLLDSEGASKNRDDMATFLYEGLFNWINEYINSKLCRDNFYSFTSVLDLPAPQDLAKGNSLDQLVVNFANEYQHRFIMKTIFEKKKDEYEDEGIAHLFREVTYPSNSECVRLMTNRPGGLVHIMDDQARRMPKKTDKTMVDAFAKRWSNHASFKLGPMDRSGATTFAISHYSGPVNYTSDQLLQKNADNVNPDFVSLLRGRDKVDGAANTITGSSNSFVRGLFSTMALTTQIHPRNTQTVVAVQHSVKPARAPSTKRPNRAGTLKRAGTAKRSLKSNEDELSEDEEETTETPAAQKKGDGVRCVMGQFRSAMDTLFETLDETKSWFAVCVRPNGNQLPNQFDARFVKAQLATLAVPEMAKQLYIDYSVTMTHVEFCQRYETLQSLAALSLSGVMGSEAREKCGMAKELMGWSDEDASIGRVKVFLSNKAFREIEDELRASDPDEMHAIEKRALFDADIAARGTSDPFSSFGIAGGNESLAATSYVDLKRDTSSSALPIFTHRQETMDDGKSGFTELSAIGARSYADTQSLSIPGTESYAPSKSMFFGANEKSDVTEPVVEGTTEMGRISPSRRKWVALVWMLTFWIPTPFMRIFKSLKRPDIRMAWREKLAINLMIWFICGCAIFVIAVLGNIICPKEHVYSESEFQSNATGTSMTSIRGEVFNLDQIMTMHHTIIPVVSTNTMQDYAGIDATPIFPVQVNALCNGVNGQISPWVQLSSDNVTDVNAKYHDFRAIYPQDTRPDWYYESMVLLRSNFRIGFLGYTKHGVEKLIADGRSVGIYRGEVYDVTDYINQGFRGAIKAPEGQRAPPDTDAAFMAPSIIQLFSQNPGQDITKKLDSLPLSDEILQRQRVCLRNLFFIGKQDHRNSPQCLFSRYILLALSIILVAVIGFKFIAALQFGRERRPEEHDKFVICQVPCYTEGEDSMRKTINSLAALKYDDKRKLLFIICDGMIVGSGNDRPTPRIVLDILGSDPNLEPEPLSFYSLGEGNKQHNMAKVYSGLYEYHGHIVPYVVVVKVGKPSERYRPGNRGKRDSQLLLMRFLNKVHFGLAMSPVELEVYHQIKNVIGVNPTFYEYLMQVDADTEVDEMSLNRFIGSFIRDKKVIGMCGETSLSNAKRSIITMLQVYEYFISHYMAKAFESLFGSVTCLPGCFSIFRIRTPDTHRPLFIANAIVDEYSENRVDTLHTKNLLHLGEDRYLTTLVLKHFGTYKTTFIRDAKAHTAVPEDWSVLLSQRRRWINSTIHNLFELLSTPGLCGFCLFSMRFVVFVDLLSTIVAPVTMVYLIYLVVLVSTSDATIPLTSVLMLAAIYGLQAILFLLRRRFDMIIWMLIYILGLPIWTFFLPLYSFWHMDDFSWGNTRVVMGEKGQKIITHDEGVFDPTEIPHKTWQSYEEELWERNSTHSFGSILGANQATPAGSVYDNKDEMFGQSRPGSMHTPSLYGATPLSHRQSASFGRMSPSGSYFGAGSTYFGYQPPAHQEAHITPTHSRGPSAYSLGNSMVSNYDTPRYHMNNMQTPPTGTSPPHPSDVPASIIPDSTGLSRQSAPQLDMPLVDVSALYGTSSLPPDNTISQDIRSIITSSDLTTVTKKHIRLQLEAKYGTSVEHRRVFVNETIDKVLENL